MPIVINYSSSVLINGTHAHSSSNILTTEAYDEINVTVPAQEANVAGALVVNVQPSATDQIEFLLITSDVYGVNLTYGVNDGPPEVALDSMQSFIGAGILSFLGPNPNTFSFSNDTAKSANVRILVGRQASS